MPKKSEQLMEDILEELNELENDQHCCYFKHEQKGRERMAFLLLELNAIEEKSFVTIQ